MVGGVVGPCRVVDRGGVALRHDIDPHVAYEERVAENIRGNIEDFLESAAAEEGVEKCETLAVDVH